MIDTTSYGKAFYSLANDERIEEEISVQLEAVSELFKKNPEIIDILDTPAVSMPEKKAIIDDCFAVFQEYLRNFIKILCEEHSVFQFEKCYKAYSDASDEAHGILRATAHSAQAMSDSQISELTKKLSETTGKSVILKNEIDSKLIGGIVLRYSGKQIDGSIKSRLEDLRRTLSQTIV